MVQSSLVKLISIAIKKESSSVIRDFNEIEFLLKNPIQAQKFAFDCNIRVQERIQKDIAKFKGNYSFIFKNLPKINNQDNSNLFIINGIIGMKNFSKAISHFCISVMLERDNEPFASVIYNPITNELFYTEKGMGAFCNQKRIRSADNPIKAGANCLISTDKTTLYNFTGNLIPHISNCKALDLCYNAVNKIAKCAYSEKIPYYNIAPAILFAKESGIMINYEISSDKKFITKLQTN